MANDMLPVVGMGVTMNVGSDRYPGTIIEVSPSAKTLKVQEDTAMLVGGSTASNEQEYLITPNPKGKVLTFTLRTNGRYVETGGGKRGQGLTLGHRRQYLDPSF